MECHTLHIVDRSRKNETVPVVHFHYGMLFGNQKKTATQQSVCRRMKENHKKANPPTKARREKGNAIYTHTYTLKVPYQKTSTRFLFQVTSSFYSFRLCCSFASLAVDCCKITLPLGGKEGSDEFGDRVLGVKLLSTLYF